MKRFNPYDLNDVANMDYFIEQSLYEKLYHNESDRSQWEVVRQGILKLIKKSNLDGDDAEDSKMK